MPMALTTLDMLHTGEGGGGTMRGLVPSMIKKQDNSLLRTRGYMQWQLQLLI